MFFGKFQRKVCFLIVLGVLEFYEFVDLFDELRLFIVFGKNLLGFDLIYVILCYYVFGVLIFLKFRGR